MNKKELRDKLNKVLLCPLIEIIAQLDFEIDEIFKYADKEDNIIRLPNILRKGAKNDQ